MIDTAITVLVVICLIGMVTGIMVTWYRRSLIYSGSLRLHMKLSKEEGVANQAVLQRLADTEVVTGEISDSEYADNADEITQVTSSLTDLTMKIQDQVESWIGKTKDDSETVERISNIRPGRDTTCT